MDDVALLRAAYDAERAAYYVYVAECQGDRVRPTDVRNRPISPARVRSARKAWDAARAALKAAGGTSERVRDLIASSQQAAITADRK